MGSYQVGQKVYWNDPDGGIASGPGTITDILTVGGICNDDTIICLRMNDDGEAEVLPHELE